MHFEILHLQYQRNQDMWRKQANTNINLWGGKARKGLLHSHLAPDMQARWARPRQGCSAGAQGGKHSPKGVPIGPPSSHKRAWESWVPQPSPTGAYNPLVSAVSGWGAPWLLCMAPEEPPHHATSSLARYSLAPASPLRSNVNLVSPCTETFYIVII